MKSFILRKPFLPITLAGCFLILSGCERTSYKETVQGKDEASLTLEVAKKTLDLNQGNEVQMVVAANRHKFDGPVTLDFPHLPKGVTVKERVPLTLPAGQSEALFTLRADTNAEPKKEVPIEVTARNDEHLNGIVKVVQRVTIAESLDNLKKQKESSKAQAEARIKALDNRFQGIQTQVNMVKDNEAKVTLLRELKSRTEDFGHVKDKFEEFSSIPSNSEWKNVEKDLESRLVNLEKGMDNLSKRLEKEKNKS